MFRTFAILLPALALISGCRRSRSSGSSASSSDSSKKAPKTLKVEGVRMPPGSVQIHRRYEHGPEGAVTWITWVASPLSGREIEKHIQAYRSEGRRGVRFRLFAPSEAKVPEKTTLPANAKTLIRVERHYFRIVSRRAR